jgi:hypothetical protein
VRRICSPAAPKAFSPNSPTSRPGRSAFSRDQLAVKSTGLALMPHAAGRGPQRPVRIRHRSRRRVLSWRPRLVEFCGSNAERRQLSHLTCWPLLNSDRARWQWGDRIRPPAHRRPPSTSSPAVAAWTQAAS